MLADAVAPAAADSSCLSGALLALSVPPWKALTAPRDNGDGVRHEIAAMALPVRAHGREFYKRERKKDARRDGRFMVRRA